MIQSLTLPFEPRPRDFAARYRRARASTVGLRAKRKHRGRRVLILLAAVAVPALAAPQGWDRLGIGDAAGNGFALDPMPFERPGDSFPGSAFYYLAATEELAAGLDPSGIPSDAAGAQLADFSGGPVARAMRMDISGVDRTRAIECLTAAVYYEAASEPDQGQRSVAQVVLNRVAHPSYPNTVCGVVYQGSERITGCQFSFTCDGALGRRPNPFFWERARRVAESALSGYVEPSVGLATHYHTVAIHPYWAPSLNYITTVGAHRFYRFKGRAGEAGTYRFAYAAGEPMAVPHARNPAADKLPDPVLDPLALQRSYDAGLSQAQTGAQPTEPDQAPARAAPPPNYAPEVRQRGGDKQYSGENLPTTQGVKPEYQQSGQWIQQPGG
ncbi:MAG: cell wall hydrolase [Novosphingobium sp.]|uniref:cell wall hydrolase n=1 Tax=Novosphingobium sp. TaxID=1874826 RepID=UPI0032BDD9C3